MTGVAEVVVVYPRLLVSMFQSGANQVLSAIQKAEQNLTSSDDAIHQVLYPLLQPSYHSPSCHMVLKRLFSSVLLLVPFCSLF